MKIISHNDDDNDDENAHDDGDDDALQDVMLCQLVNPPEDEGELCYGLHRSFIFLLFDFLLQFLNTFEPF